MRRRDNSMGTDKVEAFECEKHFSLDVENGKNFKMLLTVKAFPLCFLSRRKIMKNKLRNP